MKMTLKIMAWLLLLLALSTTPALGQGDCPAQYMCTGANNLTANTGSVDEITNTNRGCLSSDEATTSYWIQVCTATAGTLQFTIAPTGNNNDYDWAVWTGAACPPTTAPLRCSYALSQSGSGGDNTGVNSVMNAPQTDFSEGVGGNQWTQDIVAIAGQCFTININNYGSGSNSFDISFGGTATLSCSPLPIEMLYIKCDNNGTTNTIEWSTASETNNDRFEVERSRDGITFEKIGEVDGAGSSTSVLAYSLVDGFPETGVNYYRVRQIDFDGTSTYSMLTHCHTNLVLVETAYFDLWGQPVDIERVVSGIYVQVTESEGRIRYRKVFISK
jgi:hypothetical protein